MTLKSLSPRDARTLADQGAVLIDIRPAGEYAREHIATAVHAPMETLRSGAAPLGGAAAVIFICRSGGRTRANEQWLGACAACDAYMLEGGLDAWKKAGLPVEGDPAQPLPLQRQVQIAAGSLVVLGVALSAALSPWFLLLPGFVGAGLVFAGLSGFCGMARLLMKMPWNRGASL